MAPASDLQEWAIYPFKTLRRHSLILECRERQPGTNKG
jgi:hypothetical protein